MIMQIKLEARSSYITLNKMYLLTYLVKW